VLDLAHRPALGAEDFLVSRSNAAAVALVDRWPHWALSSALVVGPRRTGKTHLAGVWRLRSQAPGISAGALSEGAIDALQSSGTLLVEDLDRDISDERVLFHLLNMAREQSLSVLLTSARPPGELEVALPDLRSRLRALQMVAIEMPDEALLRAVLVKLFADRQLAVEPHVIDRIALHMERSISAAELIVAEIDRRALALQRKVTRALATEAMAALHNGFEPGS
jgi:chromosomal replication initiation ATPase DnaA